MQLPNWTLGHIGVTIIAFLSEAFLCTGELDHTGNVFVVISRFITFQSCSGLPAWFGWVVFTVVSLPWLLLTAAYLFMAFNNTITGTVLGVAVLVTIAAIVGFSISFTP